MKGDFTRFTFQPAKHYTRVFMQQGRLQLDADWNEQMDIQAYLNLRQVQHMIGATAGTPGSGILKNGFKVTATPDGKDLIINPGQFYVGGVLCELVEGTKVFATYRSGTQIQIPFLEIDGQPFVEGQWIQILGYEDPYKIKSVNLVDMTLIFDDTSKSFRPIQPASAGSKLEFLRLTTYLTQPDYPNPTPPKNDKSYLVYLDVWQRHITAIEDPTIREIALADVPDTTTRVKTIWQVKLKELSADEQNIKLEARIENIEATKTWKQLTQSRRVSLTAQAKPTTNGLSDPRIGNQLYRVEIHKGGGLNEARFKWSRDNGTVVSAIKEFRPQQNAIILPKPVRDTSQSFSAGQWIEISDEVRELNNQPGTLVRLKEIVVRTEDKLIFDPATIVGDPIDDTHFPIANKPKVRRWDWTQNEAGGLSVKQDWIDLENGIQVKFDIKLESDSGEPIFETGDYWLIPSRINPLKPLEWPQDSAKTPNPLPQAPLGIYHQFALLALVIPPTSDEFKKTNHIFPTAKDDEFYWDKADKRTTFPPLINCFDKNGDTIPGPLGIGVKPPIAQLHVKGASAKTINDVSIQNSTITGKAGSQFKANLHPGDLITIATSSGETQTRVVTEVNDNQTATVNQPFTTVNNIDLNYQQPVLRLDTSSDQGNPQFLLNAAGNIGIGTIAPTAKLDIQGATTDDKAAGLQVTNSAKTSLLYVRNDGNIGVGISTPTTKLDVRGKFKVGILDDVDQGFFQIEAQKDSFVHFTTNTGYHFDKDATSASGSPSVSSDVTVQIGSSNFFKIEPQKDAVKLTSNAGYLFDQTVTIASGSLKFGTDPNSAQLTAIGTNSLKLYAGDPNNSYVQLALENNNVKFTTSKDKYSFDKNAIFNQGLEIASGSLKLGADPNSAQLTAIGTNSLKLYAGVSADNYVQLALENNNVKFTTSKDKYSFDKNATFNQGLEIASGSLKLGADPNSAQLTVSDPGTIKLSTSDNSVQLALDDKSIRFTNDKPTEYFFNQPVHVNKLIIDSGDITISSGIIKSSANQLFLLEKTFIGAEESSNRPVPDNGLLVAGHVGIGLPTSPNRGAKLEIESTQYSEADKNLSAFALNVQTGNSRLFSIQNNGDTTVTQRLLINPPEDTNKSFPLNSDVDIKLYVGGKIYARDMTVNKFQVLSSRMFKQDIVELSSQEVDEVLRSLNPVKFAYKADKKQTLHLGFIAEDVPEVVASSDRRAISPVEIVAALTKVVKDHRQAILTLSKMVKDQQKAISVLTRKINELENNHK